MYIVSMIMSVSFKGIYCKSLVLTRKAELAGFRNFQQAVVSLLFETELQTRARWKGYCRESYLETRSGRPYPPGAHTGAPNAPFSQISWEFFFLQILEKL